MWRSRRRQQDRRIEKEREKEDVCASIVSVVNPRNDLGETSSKEKRAREGERKNKRTRKKRAG